MNESGCRRFLNQNENNANVVPETPEVREVPEENANFANDNENTVEGENIDFEFQFQAPTPMAYDPENSYAPVAEAQAPENVFEQTTASVIDYNYDSAENLNLTWNDSLMSQVPSDGLLVDLLEGMRDMGRQFQVIFDQNDDLFDENWPRQLTLTEKMEKYELGFELARALGIEEQYYFPHPRTFHGLVYHGVTYARRSPPPRVQNVLNMRPASPVPLPNPEEVQGAQALDPILAHALDPILAQIPDPLLPDPEPILHPQLEAEHLLLTRSGHAALDRELELNPGLFNLVRNPFETYAVEPEHEDEPPIDADTRSLRGLLVRCTLRAEIMNLQLDNALGRLPRVQNSNAWTRNTYEDLLSRYDQIAISMAAREREDPIINEAPVPEPVPNRQAPHFFHLGATSTPAVPETEDRHVGPLEETETSAIDAPIVQNGRDVNLEGGEVPSESDLEQTSNIFEISTETFEYGESFDRNVESDDSFDN